MNLKMIVQTTILVVAVALLLLGISLEVAGWQKQDQLMMMSAAASCAIAGILGGTLSLIHIFSNHSK